MDAAPTDHWPLFGLRIRTERLELRLPTDDDLMALADVVHDGIHDPATMPFLVPWTDLPSPELERSFLRFMWQSRSSWSATEWRMPFAVIEAGRAIGVQALRANDFPTRRLVETGSWLGRAYQGRGIGTEMRAAVLHLAFFGLGATRLGGHRCRGIHLHPVRDMGHARPLDPGSHAPRPSRSVGRGRLREAQVRGGLVERQPPSDEMGEHREALLARASKAIVSLVSMGPRVTRSLSD